MVAIGAMHTNTAARWKKIDLRRNLFFIGAIILDRCAFFIAG